MILKYHLQTWLSAAMRGTPRSNTLASLARRFPTGLIEGESERLAWLGNVGALGRHEGETKINRPLEYAYSIMNDKFSRGAAIPGAWARNDRTQQARGRMAQLGARYAQWPGKLVATLIENGFSKLAYDGQAFFSAAHSVGSSGTFSNLITSDIATPAAPTADEVSKAVNKAIATMLGQPDDQGEPFNEGMESVAIVCHSDFADVFTAALTAPNLDTGTGVRTNSLLYSDVKRSLIASPRFANLKANNRFVVVRNDSEATAFLMQENPAESRVAILDENSDHYKKQDELVAEIFAVGNAGYGNPQDALAVTFI